MAYWCVEHLHRLPEEIGLPEHLIRRAIEACKFVRQQAETASE